MVAKWPAVLARPGTLLMLTLTAPGERRHRKGGAGDWCDCTPEGGVDLAEWNGSQGERFNRFLQDLRRSGLLGEQVEYMRAVETQRRGALHEHMLIRVAAPVNVTGRVVAQLRRLAIEHGYGHELVLKVAGTNEQSARLAAWYCAKYVSKSADDRELIPWRRRVIGADRQTGEVRMSPRSYRTWTCSWRWGSSMKAVVAAQREHVRSEQPVIDGRRFDPVTFWPSAAAPTVRT